MDSNNEKPVKLVAVGDIVLHNKFDDEVSGRDCNYPFDSISKIVSSSDIGIANLEGPFSLKGTPLSYKSSLRSHPFWFKGLTDAGFNFFNLCNNHIFDYGEEAIVDTISLIEDNSLTNIGYGENLKSARKPVVFEHDSCVIGFLTCCSVVNKAKLYATENSDGIPFLEIDDLVSNISKLKGEVDSVVVFMHWGLENYHYPTLEQRKFGHAAIDAGASIIIGHHPHVVQGVEKYMDGVIFYSLGNFIFDHIKWNGISVDGDPYVFEKKWSGANLESIVIDATISRAGFKDYKIHFFRAGKEMIPLVDERWRRKVKLWLYSFPFKMPYAIFWVLYSSKKEVVVQVVRHFKILIKIITKPQALKYQHILKYLQELKVSVKVVLGKIVR